MSKTVKRIIIIVVILAVIIIGASFLYNPDSSTKSPLQSVTSGQTGAPLTQSATTDTALANTQEINREFVSMLLNLQSITLDDDIFSEPAFKALMDNTIRLNQPGNEGRPNPFAPIGTDSFVAQQVSAAVGSAQINSNVEFAQANPNNSQNTNSASSYTGYGISFELPDGFTPTETVSEGGPATVISLPDNNFVVYVSDPAWWNTNVINGYTAIGEEQIGAETFSVFTYGDQTLYWLQKGLAGYEFHGTTDMLEMITFSGQFTS